MGWCLVLENMQSMCHSPGVHGRLPRAMQVHAACLYPAHPWQELCEIHLAGQTLVSVFVGLDMVEES